MISYFVGQEKKMIIIIIHHTPANCFLKMSLTSAVRQSTLLTERQPPRKDLVLDRDDATLLMSTTMMMSHLFFFNAVERLSVDQSSSNTNIQRPL